MRWGLALLVSLALAGSACAQPKPERERPLSLHLSWTIGERVPVLTLDYELGDEDERSTLKIDSSTMGGVLIMNGQVSLPDAEVKQVLAAAKTANFWRVPDDAAPDTGLRKGPDGVEYQTVCQWSGFELRAQTYDRRKWISRDCLNEKDAPLRTLARVLIGVAQKHFPDLTAHPAWRAVLQ